MYFQPQELSGFFAISYIIGRILRAVPALLHILLGMSAAPAPLLHSLCELWSEFTLQQPLRVAVGNYNINGGKHFRSVVFKDVSLESWLLPGPADRLLDIGETGYTVNAFIYAFGHVNLSQ